MSSSDSDASLSTYNSTKRASSSNSNRTSLEKSSSKKRASSADSDMSLPTSSSKKRVATDEILDNLTATGRQKKIKLSDALSEYCTAGRKAVVTLSPFANMSLAFHYGMTLDKGGSSSSNISEEQQRRFLAFYNTILDFVPGFRANLDDLSYDELKPYITAISSSMSSQRSDDFSSLKYSMLEYILANCSTDTLQPPIPKSSCKSNRGVNHPRLARELCPKKWLNEFDDDADLQALLIEGYNVCKMEHGLFWLPTGNWPSFLYPADAVYDAEDPIIGLFCGHAGIRAFQHLYLGPAAAGLQDNDDKDGKHGGGKSKCTMYGLTKVTPQSWAWAMCVAWFSLCSCNSYRLTIGSFSLEEFFFAIVETLDDAEDPWTVETLEWINEQVFGKHAAKAMMATSNDADSDLAKMRAKRAAHKQGAPSTTATSNPVASAPPRLPRPKPTRKEAAPSTAATSNSVASAPPRHPPPEPLTPATSNAALVGSIAVSVPPPSQRPVTPPSRLSSLAPSSPLSLLPSPKLPPSLKPGTSIVKPAEPATAPSEPATTDNAPAAPTDHHPPPTARRKVVPKPKPAKPKSSVRPTRLVASCAQVDVEEPAPVIPQKKKAVPRRGRKAA
ncbi:uncharacterized protein HD556DRAFT_1304535 [Suillus plorans]|uniref:Uncharacterized protein n=1 Tax=Suillus plorans TaxID=116603 RepID=A0A9P7DRJ0_9AGAM|nr:uncharacterized protein HD556DRAFT_1304535 [Suillus plorans]KAG1801428.1 hypothetical protein HD556DRAFT_1304535 [Suillus plorans]